MDKTQTPPGRDGGDEDAGKKEYYGKPVKAKDAADDAEKELNRAMNNAHKNKARKMYELADRLSKVDTSKLNEQQLVEHTGMIKRLGEELKAMRGVAEAYDDSNYTREKAEEISNAIFNYKNIGAKNRELKKYLDDYNARRYDFYDPNALLNRGRGRADFNILFFVPKGYEQNYDQLQAYKDIHEVFMKAVWPLRRQQPAFMVSQPVENPIKTVDNYTDPMFKQPQSGTIYSYKFGFAAPTKPGMGEASDSGEDMKEAPEEDLHTSYNVVKLGGALNIDPRSLRMAIARGMQGNPTRTDMMTLSNAFLNLLKNSDDQAIQQFANLVKSGNPRAAAGREVPQESTAAIAERNAFVDAMRQVKKGEKFTVGGKEFTKTTAHGEDEKVEESIDTEAYDRLKKVFDFSDYKG